MEIDEDAEFESERDEAYSNLYDDTETFRTSMTLFINEGIELIESKHKERTFWRLSSGNALNSKLKLIIFTEIKEYLENVQELLRVELSKNANDEGI